MPAGGFSNRFRKGNAIRFFPNTIPFFYYLVSSFFYYPYFFDLFATTILFKQAFKHRVGIKRVDLYTKEIIRGKFNDISWAAGF